MNLNHAGKVAQLARDMASGYAAHITASRIAPRLSHKAFIQLIGDHPTDSVPRKNGPPFTFGTQDTFYDALVRDTIREEFPRIWLTGSLLAVGDEDLTGPPASAAFDKEGKPTRAAEAFAAKLGCAVAELKTVETPKGKYLAGTRREQGKPTLDLLSSVANHLDELERQESPPPVVVTQAERLKLIERFEKSRQQPPD